MTATYFQTALSRQGYISHIEGKKLKIPSLAMTLAFSEPMIMKKVTMISTRVHHPTLFPEGFEEVFSAEGTGEKGIEDAVNSWMSTDFPVYRACLSLSKADFDVKRINLETQINDARLGWSIYISPLYVTGYSANLGKDSNMQLYDLISDNLICALGEPMTVVLKFVVTWDYKGRGHGMCRVNGGIWVDAQRPLAKFVKALNGQQTQQVREQCILVVSTPISELDRIAIDDPENARRVIKLSTPSKRKRK